MFLLSPLSFFYYVLHNLLLLFPCLMLLLSLPFPLLFFLLLRCLYNLLLRFLHLLLLLLRLLYYFNFLVLCFFSVCLFLCFFFFCFAVFKIYYCIFFISCVFSSVSLLLQGVGCPRRRFTGASCGVVTVTPRDPNNCPLLAALRARSQPLNLIIPSVSGGGEEGWEGGVEGGDEQVEMEEEKP